jgi:hypothetical protein
MKEECNEPRMGGRGGMCPYKHMVRLTVDLVGFGHVGGGGDMEGSGWWSWAVRGV